MEELKNVDADVLWDPQLQNTAKSSSHEVSSREKSTAQLLSITELSEVHVYTIPSLWGINTQIY